MRVRRKVLVIDDDRDLTDLIKSGLEHEKFIVEVARNGKEGLRKAYEFRPDVIVLDVMMPQMDGWLTCQRLRAVSDTPIIILSALDDQAAVIKGLGLGADAYVAKPFSLARMIAHINAVLRRAGPQMEESWRAVYRDEVLTVDMINGTLTRHGEPVPLTPIETRLLLYLMSHKGQVVPHKDLLRNVWGPEFVDETRYLSVYIRYLRRKIEDDPKNPRYIRTRWGIGYYFDGPGEFYPA